MALKGHGFSRAAQGPLNPRGFSHEEWFCRQCVDEAIARPVPPGASSRDILVSWNYTLLGLLYARHLHDKPMLVLVLMAIGCYAMSLAPVTWVVIAEIFPNRIRGFLMSIAITALWIACFILTYSFPLLNASLGVAGTFWCYAAICLAGLIFIYFRLPETKGQSLEEIESKLQ